MRTGSGLGSMILFLVLEVVGVPLRLGLLLLLDIEGFRLGLRILTFTYSFDTVDRGILDRVLNRLGLLAGFRHAYFKYHAHVRPRFKLASGVGQSWTCGGDIFRDAR